MRGNPITAFEIRQSDLSVFRNLTSFRTDAFESQGCDGKLETIEGRVNIRICVLDGAYVCGGDTLSDAAEVAMRALTVVPTLDADDDYLEKYGFSDDDDAVTSTFFLVQELVSPLQRR